MLGIALQLSWLLCAQNPTQQYWMLVGSSCSDLNLSSSVTLPAPYFTARNIIGTSYTATIPTGATLQLGCGNATGTTSAILAGAGELKKIGTGAITLTATNTYTGNTTITGGTLQIGDCNTGSLGGGTYAGAITNSGSLVINTPANQTLSGVISGAGTLTKLCTSTAIFTAANTYTGTTTITTGAMQIGNGGTTGSIANTANIVNNSSLVYNLTTDLTQSQIISGTGNVTQNGPNTITLSGVNTYTGQTNVNAGKIISTNTNTLSGNINIAPGAIYQTPGGGSLKVYGDGTLKIVSGNANSITSNMTKNAVVEISGMTDFLNSNAGGQWGNNLAKVRILNGTNVDIGSNCIIQASGFISEGGFSTRWGDRASSIRMVGDGTYLNTGTMGISPYTGGPNYTQTGIGTQIFTGNTRLGDLSINNGILQFGINTNTTYNLVGTTNTIAAGAKIVDQSNSNNTISVVIGGAGSIEKNGSGILTMTGANTYTGATTINDGVLQIGNGGTTGSIASTSNIINNSSLIYNVSTNPLTQSQLISGTGNIINNGTGKIILTAANTYSGGTTINAGAMVMNTDNPFGTGALTINTNGTLRISDGDNVDAQLTNPITLNGGTIYNISSGAANSPGSNLSGLITNNGVTSYIRTYYNTHHLILSGGLAGTGNLILTEGGGLYPGGIIKLSAPGTFSGTVNITGKCCQIYPVDILNNNALQFATVDMTPATLNAYLRISTPNALIAGLTGGTTNSYIFNADATQRILTVNNTTDFTYNGLIGISGDANANKLSLVKTGTGKLTLSGANTYTGTTLVSNGTLSLSYNGGTIGSGDYIVNQGGTLDLTTSNYWTFNPTNFTINGGIVTLTAAGGANRVGLVGKNITFGPTGGGTITIGANVNATWSNNTFITQGGARNVINGSGFNLNFGSMNFNVARGTDPTIDLLVDATAWNSNFGMSKDGNGILAISNAFTFTGGLNINAGTLQIGNGGAGGSIPNAANINDAATLVYNTTTNLTQTQVISGAGTIIKNSTNNLTLDGANTYTGGTTINAGTITCGNVTCLGTGTVTINAGATLNKNGFAIANTIVNNGGTVIN